MRTIIVLLLTMLCSISYAAPKSAKPAKAPKPTAKSPEAFFIVTCTSQCLSTQKSVRLAWSDGWSAPDAKKLQRDLERTCVADLRAAECKKPACSCVAKLAVRRASQSASRPATTQPVVTLTQAKKVKASDGDLPRPEETRVEATP